MEKRAIADFHARLHRWYRTHGRHDLPWRNTADPYPIYISEIMLQQTQVKTVLERFYHPFLKRFPTLQALADAPLDDVLKQWEGLGYYNRAANLHKAARTAGEALPQTVEALEALPGIGRNTAHAVAAFAHHAPVPVMEANVKRVLCRIFTLKKADPKQLWEKAFQLLDKTQPFDYNQAMMDIGSMVCTKRNPACDICPSTAICKGKASPEAFPEAVKKKATPVRKRQIIAWRDNKGRYYLAPREGRFLNGLYGFAEYPETADTASFYNHAYRIAEGECLGNVSQTYSHFRLDGTVWRIEVGDAREEGWFALEALDKLALSGVDHKVVSLLISAD
ncbi:MAG: A/G-specific adenine glycosylase [Rickettsiales bacterium]